MDGPRDGLTSGLRVVASRAGVEDTFGRDSEEGVVLVASEAGGASRGCCCVSEGDRPGVPCGLASGSGCRTSGSSRGPEEGPSTRRLFKTGSVSLTCGARLLYVLVGALSLVSRQRAGT